MFSEHDSTGILPGAEEGQPLVLIAPGERLKWAELAGCAGDGCTKLYVGPESKGNGDEMITHSQ